MRTERMFWISAFFILALALLAPAQFVDAQSNLNCSIYPRLSVPGTMTPIFNMYLGNDTHVEYANLTNYDYTVACESNITTLNSGCSNNFVSVVQLYNYTDAHVSIDSYYNRHVCLNTSNTSLTWTLSTSAIGATPADYECAFSIFNDSNAHAYTCDNINASYNVNLRLDLEDIIPPTNNITIYGPNGTEVTGTRNVHLNLSYYDESGVDKCKWANDLETNLDNYPWENCTAVKEWILSEGEGNKTVWFSIRDTGGQTSNVSDWILYYYTQDYTPPTPPTVYDGLSGDDIDWWNSNDTLRAHWFGSTDDITDTIRYRYRIWMNQTACYGNDCSFTDVGTDTQVSVEGLSLLENTLYSFEVQAYVGNNLTSSGMSDGANIDLTDPDTPTINSSTHPDSDAATASAAAMFNWTATDPLSYGNRSDIYGYSYVLDSHPGTAPDNIVEERHWESLASLRQGSLNQTLKTNSTGDAFAVFSQVKTNFTENESVRVRVALAERFSDYDDLMGVAVYLIRVSKGTEITAFSQGIPISDINNVSWDIAYSEYLSSAAVYQFNLTVNETVYDDTYDFYVVVRGSPEDDDNRQDLDLAGTQNNVDTSTLCYVCDENNNCDNRTASYDYAIEVRRQSVDTEWSTMYNQLGDGTYYFHVKAQDKAGNWGDTGHYRIIVAAGGVSVVIAYPESGAVFETGTGEVNVSVRVVVSGNASVFVTAEHGDGSSFTSSAETFSTEYTFGNITLETGQNRIYATANTSAGAVTVSTSTYVLVSAGPTPITNKTLRVLYPACWNSPGSYICRDTETLGPDTYLVGMGAEVNTVTGDEMVVDTSEHSVKIFLTKSFNLAKADRYLSKDEFLDQKNPSFAYGEDSPSYIIQNELRYEDIFIAGDIGNLAPGKYNLYINHHGVTEDGKVNLSISIGE